MAGKRLAAFCVLALTIGSAISWSIQTQSKSTELMDFKVDRKYVGHLLGASLEQKEFLWLMAMATLALIVLYLSLVPWILRVALGLAALILTELHPLAVVFALISLIKEERVDAVLSSCGALAGATALSGVLPFNYFIGLLLASMAAYLISLTKLAYKHDSQWARPLLVGLSTLFVGISSFGLVNYNPRFTLWYNCRLSSSPAEYRACEDEYIEFLSRELERPFEWREAQVLIAKVPWTLAPLNQHLQMIPTVACVTLPYVQMALNNIERLRISLREPYLMRRVSIFLSTWPSIIDSPFIFGLYLIVLVLAFFDSLLAVSLGLAVLGGQVAAWKAYEIFMSEKKGKNATSEQVEKIKSDLLAAGTLTAAAAIGITYLGFYGCSVSIIPWALMEFYPDKRNLLVLVVFGLSALLTQNAVVALGVLVIIAIWGSSFNSLASPRLQIECSTDQQTPTTTTTGKKGRKDKDKERERAALVNNQNSEENYQQSLASQ